MISASAKFSFSPKKKGDSRLIFYYCLAHNHCPKMIINNLETKIIPIFFCWLLNLFFTWQQNVQHLDDNLPIWSYAWHPSIDWLLQSWISDNFCEIKQTIKKKYIIKWRKYRRSNSLHIEVWNKSINGGSEKYHMVSQVNTICNRFGTFTATLQKW